MIRAVIADDEPLARKGLRLLLQGEPDVRIVGEATDGSSAVAAIREHRPDLVLLDVQMPDFDGFEVVRRAAEQHLPAVVFVSAHDQFALRAFEVHALHYLLKPVTPERLREAMERVRRDLSLEPRAGAEALARLVEAPAAAPATEPAAAPGVLHRFVVRDRDRYLLVRDDEIAWVGAAGNYVALHARGQELLMRGTLTELEGRLDPAKFARIHRSTIVALDHVREIVPDSGGDFRVRLEQGDELRMSRHYRDRLLSRG